MNRLVAWFASNPVAANLLMVFIVVAGLVSAASLRQEVFPNVAFDTVSVSVVYPGAAPDEVEEAVCIRIEEAIHGVQGIDRIYARATEGFGAVWAQLELGADPSRVLDQVRTRVDALDTLPEEAERPVIRELVDDSVLLGIAVHGDVDPRTLRLIGERVRDDVAALPEVTRSELVGVRAHEISIEVSEATLRRYGLRFDDVVNAVRASSVEIPGGALKTRAGEILVRAQARAYRGAGFERLLLLTRGDGSRVMLGDVARVRDGFEESDEHLRFDGRPAVMVRLMTSERANVLDISLAARAYLEEARADIPVGVELAIWADQSIEFRSRRDLLLRNGLEGLALIAVILTLFLSARVAFWVSAGIPIAFLGAFVALGALDVSINMMSMFAFIVALGLVVDDAIIIGENVTRHRAAGGDALASTIAAVREVAVPVLAAVATTLIFVAPTLSLPTSMGKIAYSLGVVAIACLVFSLVEALLILPAHLTSHLESPPPRAGARGAAARGLARSQSIAWAGLEHLGARIYRPLLARALAGPGVTLAVSASMLMVALGALAGGWVPYAFLPNVEGDFVAVRLAMPDGTPPEVVERALVHLESEAAALGAELEVEEGHPVFVSVLSAVGDRPDYHDDFQVGGEGPNVAHVAIQLLAGERRDVTSLEVKERWREAVGGIPGALSLVFRGSDFSPNRLIDVSLSGPDPAELQRASEALKRALAAHPGVREIADSQSGGKQELALRIRPEAESLGLSLAELARQVRQGFHGEEVQRVQRGRDDVAVRVRYPLAERRSLRDLESIWLRLPDGRELPFSAVAEADVGVGYASVERRDRRRNISVTADVDYSVSHPRTVLADLSAADFPRIAAGFPGLRFDLDGQTREEAEMTTRLWRDFLLAMIATYALLAVPLRSYLQPLLIVVAIPFGLMGGIVGHLLLGLQVSAFSMIGVVALTGVVVNDALLLIDRANRRREAGDDIRSALLEAGAARFRPILLTSLTTFFGLMPLLFEQSAQALWLKPMAVTLAFGVMFATGITLVIVPAAYVVLEEAIARGRRLLAARTNGPAAIR